MTTEPSGFYHDGETILFIDVKGKDNMESRFPIYDGTPRYRADLYYKPGFAKTAFFYGELAYEVFLAANRPKCYPTYESFCNEAHQRRLCRQARMTANNWQNP